MLRINAIKIQIVTADGQYGFEQSFQNGLNIIRGNNSSGKSSLFQAILYALGLEELLGGKNEKTMQSVLKDQVEFPDSNFHEVLQSEVFLEIENKNTITIRRAIISPTESPKLVYIYYGNLLTGNNRYLKKQSMYIHDKGGATDITYGFHFFLSEFLGWSLPEVMNNQGQPAHLYIQQIAPVFMIEQKSGWSDFFSTMPYYGIKQATSRVIEFILNMDIFENQKKKTELNYREDCLKETWKTEYIKISNLARDTRYDLQGLTENPSILNIKEVFLTKETKNGVIDIESELLLLQKEYEELSQIPVKSVGENAEIFEKELNNLQYILKQKSLLYDVLNSDLLLNEQQLEELKEQLLDVSSDLQKNKSALKIRNLGGEIQSEIAVSICPTCHQHIEDSLLPHNVQEIPMSIDENIQYLESKKKMIEKYIEGQSKKCNEYNRNLDILKQELANIRAQIRSLKKDLIEDNRLPSISDIEYRLNLKKKIDFFDRKIDEFNELKEEFRNLSIEYKQLLVSKKNILESFSSDTDRNKVNDLEFFFKTALTDFKYESKPIETIRISPDDYLPLTQLITGEKYNIRFDSSASDFIRCLWAYYIALMQTSLKYKGNHPNLLMFDEPKQQDMSEEGFKIFLHKLSEFSSEQVLVFASFENKDESFLSATEGLTYNLIRIEEKLIKPLT
jgi:hypothetical protein